jgi:hypothetical protein
VLHEHDISELCDRRHRSGWHHGSWYRRFGLVMLRGGLGRQMQAANGDLARTERVLIEAKLQAAATVLQHVEGIVLLDEPWTAAIICERHMERDDVRSL